MFCSENICGISIKIYIIDVIAWVFCKLKDKMGYKENFPFCQSMADMHVLATCGERV